MRKMTAFVDTIPNFMRRPLERSPIKLGIEVRRGPVAPILPQPRQVIHGGTTPIPPDFLILGAVEIPDPLINPGTSEDDSPPPLAEGGVVDLTAHRSAALSAEPAPRTMSRALHAVFEAEAENSGEDDDVAFQVTLPRSVIRQIRLFAAEEGTTHRAVVLRALRTAGLNIPEGADVDRRAVAARRRQQA